jgi:hypothetical protein
VFERRRWVKAEFFEQGAKVNQASPIESQRLDGRPPSSGQPDHAQLGVVPSEMVGPVLAARVEEGHRWLSQRIPAAAAGMFMTVTALARPSQILEAACASKASGKDMIHGEGVG